MKERWLRPPPQLDVDQGVNPSMGPDSPLGQAVQRLLEADPDGLHKAELLRRLRQTNPFAQEQHLNEILAHPDTFAERPGEIWVLTKLLESSQPDEPPVDEPPMYEREPLDIFPLCLFHWTSPRMSSLISRPLALIRTPNRSSSSQPYGWKMAELWMGATSLPDPPSHFR